MVFTLKGQLKIDNGATQGHNDGTEANYTWYNFIRNHLHMFSLAGVTKSLDKNMQC